MQINGPWNIRIPPMSLCTYSPVPVTFSITMATFRATAVEYRSYGCQKEGWIWTVLGSAELGKGGEFCEELEGE